jgi:MFS family permease
MPSHVRAPAGLHAARLPGRWVFATLFLIESIARASISAVIPIQAYDLLQDEQKVGTLYTILGVVALGTTVMLPVLAKRLPRRWLYSLGCLGLMGAAAAFAMHDLFGQVAGMFLRVFGAASLSVTLSLYILDAIGKRDLVRTESLRLAMSTAAWTAGPWLGVYLYTTYGYHVAFGWSAAWAFILLVTFWAFRLSDSPLRPGPAKPTNPVTNIARFVAQPRLRLAWLIAFMRSCFWSTFFVWVPIMMVAGGEGKLAGGLVVSVGNATLFSTLFWGPLAQRFSLRWIITGSFIGIGVGSLAACLTDPSWPWVAAGFLIFGTLFAAALDGVGGVPFLRAVRSYERPQMTSVYRTYLDASELVPPLVFTVLLTWFELHAVFVVLAIAQFVVAAVVWRHMPRSMR